MLRNNRAALCILQGTMVSMLQASRLTLTEWQAGAALNAQSRCPLPGNIYAVHCVFSIQA